MLLLSLLGASCKKNHAPAVITNFPQATATRWTYAVYDSLHGYPDTQTVIISGDTTLQDGRSAKTVIAYFASSIDTTRSFVSEDAVHAIFYINDQGKDYNKIYLFPLKVGASWLGENVLDTSKVVSNQNIQVPAGNFSTYLIHRNYAVTNTAITETEWYTAGVGVVQRTYYERNIGFTVYKTFRLLSYKIGE